MYILHLTLTIPDIKTAQTRTESFVSRTEEIITYRAREQQQMMNGEYVCFVDEKRRRLGLAQRCAMT